MNINRDRLDDAIDATAARMTRVADDAALAARIASALPDRRTGVGWILTGWAPRLAMLALAAGAMTVVLRMFDDGSTIVLRTEGAPAPIVEPVSNARRTSVEPPSNDRRTPVEPPSNDRRTAVEPASNVRRTFVEPSSNVRRTTVAVDRPDHERSLAAIAAPEALDLDPLTPASLPEDAPLTIESLEIADLPLSADFSPR